MNMIIAIEGINGGGKTTLINRLVKKMPHALVIRSPGGTHYGEKIRQQIKDAVAGERKIPPQQLAQMNIRGFKEAQRELIEPAFSADTNSAETSSAIILDRWSESTHAYQGAMGVCAEFIDAELSMAGIIRPDITLLLDMDERDAHARHHPDIPMNEQQANYKKKARAIFLARASKNPNTAIIDASKNDDDVFLAVTDTLEKKND